MPEEEIKIEELGAVQPKKKRELNIPAAIVVAGALIAIALMVRVSPSSGDADSGRLDLIPDVSADDFIRGEKDAPVTIIEYADYKCPACAAYQPILAELVAESGGEVRWIYRDFPIFSEPAAVASRCVGKILGEESFWQYSDALFSGQEMITSDFLKEKALSFGAGSEAYDSCIADPVLKNEVHKNYNRLKYLLGFSHTPTTIMVDKNGRKYVFTGALYKETLKDIIETLDK